MYITYMPHIRYLPPPQAQILPLSLFYIPILTYLESIVRALSAVLPSCRPADSQGNYVCLLPRRKRRPKRVTDLGRVEHLSAARYDVIYYLPTYLVILFFFLTPFLTPFVYS